MRHGIYNFINRQSGTAMDLVSDSNVLVAMPPTDSDSQKWEVAPLGDGYTIRNVRTRKYLSIVYAAREEPIVATNFPVAWVMRKIFLVEENTSFFEIRWPNSEYMFEVAEFGHRTRVTQGHVQRCRLWRAVCRHLFTSTTKGPILDTRGPLKASPGPLRSTDAPKKASSVRSLSSIASQPSETRSNRTATPAAGKNGANTSNTRDSAPNDPSVITKLEFQST